MDLSSVQPGLRSLGVAAQSSVDPASTLFLGPGPSIVIARGQPIGNIDTPADPASVTRGQTVQVKGWAADKLAPSGTGVDRVEVFFNGVSQGLATLGSARPDVAAFLGSPRFTSSGYSFSLTVPSSGLATRNFVTVHAHSTLEAGDPGCAFVTNCDTVYIRELTVH